MFWSTDSLPPKVIDFRIWVILHASDKCILCRLTAPMKPALVVSIFLQRSWFRLAIRFDDRLIPLYPTAKSTWCFLPHPCHSYESLKQRRGLLSIIGRRDPRPCRLRLPSHLRLTIFVVCVACNLQSNTLTEETYSTSRSAPLPPASSYPTRPTLSLLKPSRRSRWRGCSTVSTQERSLSAMRRDRRWEGD